MSRLDSQFFTGKGVQKNLTLQLEEGDDILACMRAALAEHNIKEATVVEGNGTLKEGLINYFQGNKFKSKDLKNARIVKASGKFLNLGKEWQGDLHIGAMFGMQLLSGTLLKGKATEGLELKLKYVEMQAGPKT